MDQSALRKLLNDVRSRKLSINKAVENLKHLPFEDLGFAKVDHHRSIRCGFPEVIYCEGKTTQQVVTIVERRRAGGGNILATRAEIEVARAVRRKVRSARYNETARTITIRQQPAEPPDCFVAIVCAGTSDLPVAEEARETCEIMDQPTRQFYDVGVAGIHRLLAHSEELSEARAVVVCAGMEGALASVVGGLVACPVVAVPTSVGYGASFGGLAPLLTMLNSCASGVSVVNIDNGFGAGYIAALIGRAGTNSAPNNAQRRRQSADPETEDTFTLPRIDAAMTQSIQRTRSIPKLPRRRTDAHKGDFGRVLIVGGSVGMVGAPSLAGLAALRSGAGLATIATPASVQPTAAAICPCATTLPLPETRDGRIDPPRAQRFLATRIPEFDAIAIGPGLGTGTRKHADALWTLIYTLRKRSDATIVLDADALNLAHKGTPKTASSWNTRPQPRTIITPHPGELARMHGVTVRQVQADREGFAVRTARMMNGDGAVVVLKGAGTIVTDGKRLYTNRTGNPGMATGGSGDVLTGVIAALLAQGMTPFDASVAGVHIHGCAGDIIAQHLGQTSLIATDLINILPKVFRSRRTGNPE